MKRSIARLVCADAPVITPLNLKSKHHVALALADPLVRTLITLGLQLPE